MKKLLCLAAFLLGAGTLCAQAPSVVEFRGAWVATVFNLNFPSRSGLSADEQKAELISLLNAAQRLRLNAVLFQVRPECDALYDSPYEPWSRYLTGEQGKSPGYDPLAFLVREARKRNIQVHAWLNPFRAAATAGKPLAPRHIARKFPEFAYKADTSLWMDPGAAPVQDQLVEVVLDLVRRYDIAGIHFDDYFYPYPKDPEHPGKFPDGRTFTKYQAAGGKLALEDWRRQNVNFLIQRLSREIHREKPSIRFGISPFGIYTPGVPAGTTAKLDQYNHIFADPVKWMKEGWVDYLAPQLYWPDKSEQSFSLLLKWWRSPVVNPKGIPIYPGIAVDRLNPPHDWPVEEIANQIRITRSVASPGPSGHIFWNIKPMAQDRKRVGTLVRERLHPSAAKAP